MIDKLKEIVRGADPLMKSNNFTIEQKGGFTNIVTSSDIAVQDYLCERLSKLTPGCGFICEEESLFDASADRVWIIDPIDGTANYARGIDACGISVALKQGDEIVDAVFYSPARGELYSASKGCGSFLNESMIHVSDRPFQDGIFCAALSLYHKEYAKTCSDIIMDCYGECNDVRRFGSAATELSFLSAGFVDLYFEMRLMPWDYAAGILLIEEAGGVISSLDGGSLKLDRPDLVCAANSVDNHRRLLSIIQKHVPELPY